MNRNRNKKEIGQELDMKPFVNFMVILAVALIVCVEFTKMAYIQLKLPEGAGSNDTTMQKEKPSQPDKEKLMLTAIITDSVLTIGAKSGFLPSINYREYHRYIDKNDGYTVTVPYTPNGSVKNPVTGRVLGFKERHDVFCYVTDTNGATVQSMHTKSGELVVDADGKPVTNIASGDTVYTATIPHRTIVAAAPDQFKLMPLSLYDELKNRLEKVKEHYTDVDDGEAIIIAAENTVKYDKIVQIMDVSREAGFPNIAIAKLRS